MSDGDGVQPLTESLSHNEVVEKAKGMLNSLIDDPFLSDVSLDDSVQDVKGLLALVRGKAITVHIKTFDGRIISVIVLQGCSVKDLMDAFQNQVQKECVRKGTTTYISWKYVWQTYCLVQGQTLLTDAKAKLSSYGVGNLSTLHFIKKLKAKNRM